MFFKDIPGQSSVKQRLLNMINEGRIPHALLFLAPDGYGNLPMAVVFAQYLFCKNKQNNEPCNICASCLKINKLAHPDLHFVFPIVLSKEVRVSGALISDFREAYINNPYLNLQDWLSQISADNKQLVIAADESNNIIKQLSYTSFEGGYKVMIVWSPEKMNDAAANKLLKILEEPPDKTIFILVAHQSDQLLTTILSRTQLVKFLINTEKEMVDFLQSKGHDTQKSTYAAKLADGNINKAIEILLNEQDAQELNLLEHFQQFMRLALKFNPFKINQWIDETSSLGREKQKQFFNYGLKLLRDCIVINFSNESLAKCNPEELEFLKKFAPFVYVHNIEAITEEFNKTIFHIERNANPKIVLMDFSLKMNELLNLKRG
jgi:DNA polymerase-3 subunit delta'